MFHGWRVVAACFVVATVAWGLGTFGASVYLQSVTAAHGWPIADVAYAITLFYLVSALVQRAVGRAIDRWGPRPVLMLGTLSMALGVALIGQITVRWQLYPCFVLIGLGWSTLSTTGISATVAPWFERHQGRSMTLAIMGASVGAVVGVPALQFAIRRLGLEQGLLVVGTVAACLLLPLIARVLRYRRPEEIGLQRDGHGSIDQPLQPPTRPPIATTANARILLWSAAAATKASTSATGSTPAARTRSAARHLAAERFFRSGSTRSASAKPVGGTNPGSSQRSATDTASGCRPRDSANSRIRPTASAQRWGLLTLVRIQRSTSRWCSRSVAAREASGRSCRKRKVASRRASAVEVDGSARRSGR